MEKRNAAKPFLIILVLFIVFGLPFVLAYYFYYADSRSAPQKTVNHGHLITPPIDMRQVVMKNSAGQEVKWQSMRGHWVLMYLDPKQCDALCQKNLYHMRQVRTAMGKEQNRVLRLIVTFAAPSHKKLDQYLQGEYRGTEHLIASQATFEQLLEHLPSAKLAFSEGYLYLVDPNGNLMMSYAPTDKPKGLFKDLEKLLKVSQIG